MAQFEQGESKKETYMPRDPDARAVYTSPSHSDGYPVYERAKALLDEFRAEGLALSCYAVTDNLGNVAVGIVAPTRDIAEQAALRKFSDRGQVSKGRMVSEDAEVDEEWFILHCQTAEDVTRYANQIRETIASTGREPVKRTMLSDLCEASHLPFYAPDVVVMLRHGGGHLPVNWIVDVDLVEGESIAAKSAATIAVLAELGMAQAQNVLAARSISHESEIRR